MEKNDFIIARQEKKIENQKNKLEELTLKLNDPYLAGALAYNLLAVKGAELLFFPTAIGSEPILECDSMPHWRRAMQGHAAANLMPVIAANRIGTEEVVPCEENGK